MCLNTLSFFLSAENLLAEISITNFNKRLEGYLINAWNKYKQ